MGKGSETRPTNKHKFNAGWERIYGNKKQDSDSSPGDRSDDSSEDLGNEITAKNPAPGCTRPQIP